MSEKTKNLTMDDLWQAFDAADKAGNEEDAREFAQIIKQQMDWEQRNAARAQAQPQERQRFNPSAQAVPVEELPEASGFGAFADKGLSTVLGAPVDITDAILGKIGLPGTGSGEAFGGSESIRRGMDRVASSRLGQILGQGAVPRRQPETVGESIGEIAGETAGIVLPVNRAAQVISQGGRMLPATANIARPGASTVQGVTGAINQANVQRPLATAAIEGASVAGAGVGRQIGLENELSGGQQAAAEIVGGVVAGVSPLVAGPRVVKSLGQKGGAWLMAPFTEQGAFLRASRRMQSLVDDPQEVAKMIDNLKTSGLRPAQMTGEDSLLALERVVLSQDPQLANRLSKQSTQLREKMVNGIRQQGRIANAKDYVQKRRQRLFDSLDARVESAADEAAARMAALSDTPGAPELNVIVRDRMESALADAKVQEGMLWAAVPQELPVPTEQTKKAFAQALGSLSSAQMDDMPAVARLVEQFDANTPLREMDGLYKKLGEISRIARAGGERNKSRIAEMLRDGIMEDMGRAGGTAEARELLQTARQYSLHMNERFRRGVVGKILQSSRDGGAAIAPELTLDASVAQRGTRGKLAAQQVVKAVDSDPLAMEALQNYYKRRFVDQAMPDGQLNPQRAQAYMQQNAEALDLFPHLREQLQAARSADDVMRRVAKRADAFRKKLDNPSVSATAKFLRAPVDKEVQAIMGSFDPSETMGQIVRQARKAPPEVMEGLRAGVSEWLIGEATSGTSIANAGQARIFGQRILDRLDDPNIGQALRKVYTEKQISGMRENARILRQLDFAEKAPTSSIGEIIDDRPNWLLKVGARVIGARTASKLNRGGGAGVSLQAAQIGSAESKKFLQKLTGDRAAQMLADAMLDPELFRAMLVNTRTATTQQKRQSERIIRNWLLSRGARLMDDEEEADNEAQQTLPQ